MTHYRILGRWRMLAVARKRNTQRNRLCGRHTVGVGVDVSGGPGSSTALDSLLGSRERCAMRPLVVVCGLVAAAAVAPAAGAATYTVQSAADSGATTLRQAILDANATPDLDTIVFALDSGTVMQPASPLPPITQPVTIDGLTQLGASANSSPDGFNAVLPVVLRGPGVDNPTTGLRIEAADVTVRGLRIDGYAPAIVVAGGDRARVVGNELSFVISPPHGGTSAWGGVRVERGSGHVIGTVAIPDTNWIHGFGAGVDLAGGATAVVGNVVQENKLGVLIDFLADARNSRVALNLIGSEQPGEAGRQGIGVFVTGPNGLIGDPIGDEGNLIVGNGIGVAFYANVAGTRIAGNDIVANEDAGLNYGSASGDTSVTDNVIAGNGGDGITLLYGAGNSFLGNLIGFNDGLGIDLGGDRVTPNDAGDADWVDRYGNALANRLQNYPVLQSAWTSGGATVVRGTLETRPGPPATVEVYSSSACDRSGSGEGEALQAHLSVPLDSAGTGHFEVSLPAIPDRTPITALATTADGTSEFSPCVPTSPAPPTASLPASPPTAPAAPRDTTAPTLTGLRVTPSRFRVGPAATPLAARRAKRGAFIRYTLSEPATVNASIRRPFTGRRANGRCVPATRALRRRPSCRGETPIGTLTRTNAKGLASIAFSGRLARRALPPGRYNLTARATDAAGNRSRAATAAFTILK
jgi:hypothetical protein